MARPLIACLGILIKYQGGMVDVSSFKIDLLTREAIQVNLQNEMASFPFLFLGISPFITSLPLSHQSSSPDGMQSQRSNR